MGVFQNNLLAGAAAAASSGAASFYDYQIEQSTNVHPTCGAGQVRRRFPHTSYLRP